MPTRQRQFAPLSLSSTADVARFCKLFSSLSPVRRLHNSLLSTTKKKSASLLRALLEEMAFPCLLSVLVRTLSKRERLAHKTTTHENATRSFLQKMSAFFLLCAFFSLQKKTALTLTRRSRRGKKGEKKTKKSCFPTGSEYLEARNHATQKKRRKTLGFSRQSGIFFLPTPPHQL